MSRLKKKEIARELSLSVKTVRRVLKEETPPAPLTRERSSQLDPFKEKIAFLLKEYPTLSCVRIREEMPEYQGGMTILKDYVRTIRPRKQEAFLRIETEPGEEGQIDWGLFGDYFGIGRILSCFSFVLSYSRMMTLVWTLSQKMEDLLRSHQKSFHFFGGVMKKALYDNMKTVVLARFGEDPKHTQEVLEEKRRAANAKSKDIFLSLGIDAEDYLKGLFQTHRSLSHELEKINALVTVYGKTEVLQAISQALPFKAFGSEYLKNIILQNVTRRGANQPLGPVDSTTRPDLNDLTVEERDLTTYEQLIQKKEDKNDG